jgi:hypothetical protein
VNTHLASRWSGTGLLLLALGFAPACIDRTGVSEDDGQATSTDHATASDASSRDAERVPDAKSEAGPAADADASDAAAPVVASRVELRSAGEYVLLAKSGISTIPTSSVTGLVGVSPVTASYVVGFSLETEPLNRFAISSQVRGKIFSSTNACPIPAELTKAVRDMEHAFVSAAELPPDTTDLGAGDVGGMTLAPGIYHWSEDLQITSDITLEGGAKDVWVFQVAKKLMLDGGAHVVLTGGALPKNVVWQVAGNVELGDATEFKGILLSRSVISVGAGASVEGRLLSHMDIRLDNSVVTEPAP